MLSEEDRKQLGEILQPMVNATKDQAETLKRQAGTLSDMGERIASVETNVGYIGYIREDLAAQKKHCQDVSSDFAKEIRIHERKIATNEGTAKTACGIAKRLSARAWAFLVSLILIGVSSITGLILWFAKKGGE